MDTICPSCHVMRMAHYLSGLPTKKHNLSLIVEKHHTNSKKHLQNNYTVHLKNGQGQQNQSEKLSQPKSD